MKGRILSGMRPTGEMHLGHLVGALSNWAQMQDEYECFYCIVDWHALMSEYKDSKPIAGYVRSNLADWIACGIDPEKSVIFVQSHVHEHLELFLVLSCVADLPRVERVPTFREQVEALKEKDVYTYAFLGYPVLQAADILVYKADTVPVGDDQLPHLELARELVRRFHSFTKSSVFPEPQGKLTEVPRLLGLDRRKMSKSYGNYIALSDPPDTIRKKVATMITDEQRIKRTDPGRPDICNVCAYHGVFNEANRERVEEECRTAARGCVDCKKELSEVLIRRLEPIRKRREELLSDASELDRILRAGEEKARAVASRTMREVREVLGL